MEVNPELAVKFFSKLEKRLSMLSYRVQNTSFGEIHKDVKVLTASVAEIADDE
jgi:hypothetical protein